MKLHSILYDDLRSYIRDVTCATGMSMLAPIPSWLMSSRNYAVSMAQAVEGRLPATKHKECSAHVALGT